MYNYFQRSSHFFFQRLFIKLNRNLCKSKRPVASNMQLGQQVPDINKTTIPPRTRQSRIPRANIAQSNVALAQQIALLTNVVTNMANAITINQAPPAATAPPAAVVAFATSPGVAAVEELIDYT
jgi:hypothetical protein